MAKYTEADILRQQARLASIFGPEETARLDAEALPVPTQAEINRNRNRRKWEQNKRRWDAWKKGEGNGR